MIRVNLLSSDKKKRQGPSFAMPSFGGGGGLSMGRPGMWIGVYTAGILVWFGCLGAVYLVTSGRLDQMNQDNAQLETKFKELEKKTEGLAEIEAALERSYQLEEVVGELERARSGPTRVLMELSLLLSSAGGPTIDPDAFEALRKEDPLAGFDDSWDVRRVWMSSFEELGGDVTIKGTGKTGEDVAEFSRRLDLSELFTDVRLLRTRAQKDQASGLEVTVFELKCKVRY